MTRDKGVNADDAGGGSPPSDPAPSPSPDPGTIFPGPGSIGQDRLPESGDPKDKELERSLLKQEREFDKLFEMAAFTESGKQLEAQLRDDAGGGSPPSDPAPSPSPDPGTIFPGPGSIGQDRAPEPPTPIDEIIKRREDFPPLEMTATGGLRDDAGGGGGGDTTSSPAPSPDPTPSAPAPEPAPAPTPDPGTIFPGPGSINQDIAEAKTSNVGDNIIYEPVPVIGHDPSLHQQTQITDGTDLAMITGVHPIDEAVHTSNDLLHQHVDAQPGSQIDASTIAHDQANVNHDHVGLIDNGGDHHQNVAGDLHDHNSASWLESVHTDRNPDHGKAR